MLLLTHWCVPFLESFKDLIPAWVSVHTFYQFIPSNERLVSSRGAQLRNGYNEFPYCTGLLGIIVATDRQLSLDEHV